MGECMRDTGKMENKMATEDTAVKMQKKNSGFGSTGKEIGGSTKMSLRRQEMMDNLSS